jgi:hypothetical protein
VYVEPPLYPWDEANLVMVNDLPDMLLDSDYHYFNEDFSSMFIRKLPIVLLFGGVFVWFWDESTIGFIKLVRQCSLPFYFVEQFKEGWY